MSMENLMAFVEATLQDSALTAELGAAVAGADIDSNSTVSAFATSRGFEVVPEEVAAFKGGMRSSLIASGDLQGDELSDDDLERVSGGIFAGGCMPPSDDWYKKFRTVPVPSGPPGSSDWGTEIPPLPSPEKYRDLGLL
ncbi:MAG: hypothetical protein ABJN75_17825 [Hoeflea sp.]|uniref:hypothetical protein n=1 Tax=Hoeflea sp. TaxID=1940281 RepID=UPI003297066A